MFTCSETEQYEEGTCLCMGVGLAGLVMVVGGRASCCILEGVAGGGCSWLVYIWCGRDPFSGERSSQSADVVWRLASHFR